MDNVILQRELGRHICPSPLLHTAITAGGAIARCGTESQKRQLLPDIIEGRAVYAFAFQERSRFFHPSHIRCEAKTVDDTYVIRGRKMFVEFADSADVLLVVARTGATAVDSKDTRGLTMFLIDRHSSGITCNPLPTMSRDRQYEVVFDDVRVPGSAILGRVNEAWHELEPILQRTAVAFCAYTNGAGFEMHEHATQYAKDRVQFDRPIGQMMTIQMYLAQTIIELYGADMLTLFTASYMDQGENVRDYVAKMKAFCAETVCRTMDIGSQIFGGMGYMEEHDTTLFLRRGKQLELSLGGTEYWLEVIAEEVIDRQPIDLT
jgi:alkylation response protein AidB-like acyl-CoA dehydrogenase